MNLVGKGATIQLIPDSSWQWSDWDGKAKLNFGSPSLTSERDVGNVVTVRFIPNHSAITVGKHYLPVTGFDKPGTMGTVDLVVDLSSAFSLLEIEHSPAVLSTTTGTFSVAPTIPATNTQTAATDLDVPKSGTWKIVEPGQKLLHSN